MHEQQVPLRRRARDVEALIAKLAAERARVEPRLADPTLYLLGKAAEMTAANNGLAAIARETEAAGRSPTRPSGALSVSM